MKTKTKEFDIDIIGGLGPLTKEEENAISAFLKKRNPARKEITRKKNRKGKVKNSSK